MVPEIKHNDFIATRAITDKIEETFASQQIQINLPAKADVATVTSFVGRLPTFDFMEYNKHCYMRFRREIMFAKSAKGFVYIIPTDDNRIKFVVAPYLGS